MLLKQWLGAKVSTETVVILESLFSYSKELSFISLNKYGLLPNIFGSNNGLIFEQLPYAIS